MPKIGSLDDLKKIRESALRDLTIRRSTGTKITVGMGTCGIAAGARETMQAILKELDSREIEANVATVGCIGMCSKEPLVDIEQAGKPRVTYATCIADVCALDRGTPRQWARVQEWCSVACPMAASLSQPPKNRSSARRQACQRQCTVPT